VVSSLQVFHLKYYVHFSSLPCMLQSCPFHLLWFDDPNNIWWWQLNNILHVLGEHMLCGMCVQFTVFFFFQMSKIILHNLEH
jgi:hypothetical protein